MYRQHIWDSRSQIDHYLPGSPIPRLVTTSSADAWGEEGRKLFRKKQYSQAAECFERAGLDRQKDMAMAYDFRQRAQQHPLDRRSLDLRSGMFLEAAQAFHRLACSTSARLMSTDILTTDALHPTALAMLTSPNSKSSGIVAFEFSLRLTSNSKPLSSAGIAKWTGEIRFFEGLHSTSE